jgi:hypothetical protein
MLHFPSEKLCTDGKHFAFSARIVCSMHMDGASSRETVADEGGPVNDRGSVPYLDQFGDRIGMEEACWEVLESSARSTGRNGRYIRQCMTW